MRSICTCSRVTQTLFMSGDWMTDRPCSRFMASFLSRNRVSSPAIRRSVASRPIRREEVDGCHFAHLPAQARHVARHLGPARLGVETALETAGFLGQPGVVLVARGDEHAAELSVVEALEQRRLADQHLAAQLDDLPGEPGKVLLRLLVAGERVDRVLHRHRAQRLQASPYLDARIGRLGRQLMDQKQPGRFGQHADIVHGSPVPHERQYLQRMYHFACHAISSGIV